MKKNSGFNREISAAMQDLAKTFPVLSITGPRQSGKTTLSKRYFHDKPYFNLEDPSQRAEIETDPKGLLSGLGENGAIFDEVHHFPELLSYLQVIVDEQQINGQFVIIGSYNFALVSSMTQSLAGRVGVLELLPMSTQELIHAGIELSTDELLYYGGLPRIFYEEINPTLVYKNYVKTYLERDMRQIINIKDLSQFRRFMQLCASRIGSEFIASNIANELGVSYHTVQSWLSALEASYIVFRLPPYFENFGKRIIKAPKLYFTDVGLASYLLGIENITHLSRDPLKGALFENLVVLDFYKYFLNQGKDARLYYYRNRSQYEIDLILQFGHSLIPIEIKYSKTFKKEFIKNLKYFENLAQDRVPQGFVVYGGESTLHSDHLYKVINFRNIPEVFEGQS